MSKRNREIMDKFEQFMQSVSKEATSVEDVEKPTTLTDPTKGAIGGDATAEQTGSTNQKVTNPQDKTKEQPGEKVEQGDLEETVEDDFKKVEKTVEGTVNVSTEVEKLASARTRLDVLEGAIRKSMAKEASGQAQAPTGDALMDKVASDLQSEMQATYSFLLPIRQNFVRDVHLLKQAGVSDADAAEQGGWEALWTKLASENPDEMLPPEAAEAVKAEMAAEAATADELQPEADTAVPSDMAAEAATVGADPTAGGILDGVSDEEAAEFMEVLDQIGASGEDVQQALQLIKSLMQEGMSLEDIQQLAQESLEEQLAAAEAGQGGEIAGVPLQEPEIAPEAAPAVAPAPTADDVDEVDVELPPEIQ